MLRIKLGRTSAIVRAHSFEQPEGLARRSIKHLPASDRRTIKHRFSGTGFGAVPDQ